MKSRFSLDRKCVEKTQVGEELNLRVYIYVFEQISSLCCCLGCGCVSV